MVIRGGFEFDGKELASLDVEAARAFLERMKGKVQSIAIVSVFSTIRNDHELTIAHLCREVMGEDVHISISSEIGSMGLIERENATILNAALHRVAQQLTEGFAKSLAEEGCAMLFAGTAMELLGASVTDRDGDTYPGIGLASFTTVQGKRRIVGDVYGVTALFPEAVVGFMNKCGQIRGVEAPLLTGLSLGFGNEAEKGPEGFHWKNVFASELTGPVLVKNPRLLEAVADAICTRRGISLPEERPSFPYAEAGYAITAEQLKLRAEARQ